MSGAAGFVKAGAGTLVLCGHSTYGGETAIEAGRVRLSSLPLEGLRLWLDASDPSTLFTNANGSGAVTASGQPVGCWGDRSGNGTSATQATASRRPTYVANVAEFGGRSALQFDGVDDDIASALDINATNLPNMTLVMVCRQVAKTPNGGLWGHDNGGWDRMQLLNLTSQSAPDCYGMTTSNAWATVKGMNTSAVLLYTAVLKQGVSNGSYVYINGLSDSTSGLPAFTSSEVLGHAALTLANISSGNGFRGNVQIGEVLVFDTALGDVTRRDVETSLRNKWLGASEAIQPVLPTNGAIRVASGAALDLGGMSQTLAAVSGEGTVSNGLLTVRDSVAPGGTNRVGVLTLPGSPTLGGATLLADVATDGAGDQLVCTGDLSLEGVALQVARLERLNVRQCYTLAVCSGRLTGSFVSAELPDDWHVRYDRTPGAGSATLYWASHATVFSVR
jgi:autotransporter-associated beta strand protein